MSEADCKKTIIIAARNKSTEKARDLAIIDD